MAEVVQTLNRIKAEGVLRIASQQGTRDIVFATGEIVGVTNRDGGEHRLILRRLALMGLVRMPEADELQQAESTVSTLIELGTVTQDQVLDLIHEQALETLYDLNTWTSADFLFHETTETDEFEQMVARHRQNGLSINVNSVLMEAARRHDEWQLIRGVFRDHDVPRLVAGHEEDTGKHRAGFPGNLLVPVIDGTHSIEEIIDDTGLTRFSVFSTLAHLQKEGALQLVAPDELHDEAERLALDGQQADAARVFRHILAARPEDSAAVTALASCLADLGDMREAADCHAQLALSHLTRDRVDDALEDATRAVELEEHDPGHRGILVRCLVQLDRLDEAADQLTIQAQQFEQNGLMEEARDTWRKVLDLRPGDDSTRHNLAAIQVKQSTNSGDVVVCLECGTVNPRERDDCAKCKAKLRLGCMVCGKGVSIADRICIFCGANPHLPADQQGPRRAGPSTERIEASAKPGTEAKQKGTEYWRAELHQILVAARELEEAGKLAEALDQWRELSRLQQGNNDLVKHIRDLEGVLHDRFVERGIARGHELRRGRHYWRALRSYGASLRGMGEDDIRGARLREIIAATRRSHHRILTIYSLAVLVIIATGILAIKPYYDVANARKLANKVENRLAALADAEAIRACLNDLDRLRSLAEGVRGGHRIRADESLNSAESSIRAARVAFLEVAFTDARHRLEAHDADGAASRLSGLEDLYDDGYRDRATDVHVAVVALRKEQDGAAAHIAAAPARLAAAKDLEKAKRLGEALQEYRTIAGLGAEGTSTEAETLAKRLGADERVYSDRVRAAAALAAEDFEQAQAAVLKLRQDATFWGQGEALAKVEKELETHRTAATTAWQAVAQGADAAALEHFLASHGAAPEGALARARLGQMRANERQRDASLERYRKAVSDREYDIAWQLATTLHQQFPGQLPAGAAPFPLQISTTPAGAQVIRGEKVVGTTPHVIAYEPSQAKAPIILRAAGFEDLVVTPADVDGWRWSGNLTRAVLWRSTIGMPARGLGAGADGAVVVVGADQVQAVKIADGARLWKVSLGEMDPNVPRQASVMPPVRLRDGTVVVSGLGTAVLVIGPDGTVQARHPIAGTLRALPHLFTNDLLGGDQRLALIGESLWTGPVTGKLTQVRLLQPTLSGTVIVRGDLDRIVVVADLQGTLIAVEESSAKEVWRSDIGGAEVGPFIPVGPERVAFLLDGSRLVCWRITAQRGQELWSRSLGGQPVGQPAASGDLILMPVGSNLLVQSATGAEQPNIELPSLATTGVSTVTGSAPGSATAAVGCHAHLVILNAGTIAWSTPVPSPVSTVGIVGNVVFAALENGTLLAYQL